MPSGPMLFELSVYKMNISLFNKVIKLLYYSIFTSMGAYLAFVSVKLASP